MKKIFDKLKALLIKKKILIVGLTVIIAAFGTGIALFAKSYTEKNEDGYDPDFIFNLNKKTKKEEAERIFKEYKKYDLIYKKSEDRLYYKDQLVRYFEDIKSENYFIKWPSKDGSVDVFAVRDASGNLNGVVPYEQQAFDDRTLVLEDDIFELQIMDNKYNNIEEGDNLEDEIKDEIEKAYSSYEKFGLVYDRESDLLYYNEELVDYFEDKKQDKYFGTFKSEGLNIYAVRNTFGKLTGIDKLSNDTK